MKHLNFEDIHNSWLYCFTDPLELGTRVSLSESETRNIVFVTIFLFLKIYTTRFMKAKHMSQDQEDK